MKNRYFLICLLSLCILCSCAGNKEYNLKKLNTYKEVAKTYIQENKYTEALEELNLAKNTDRCDPEVYNLLGIAYMGKKEFVKAENSFKKAIKLDPEFSEAYNNLGSLMLLEGRYTEAIKYFKKALENPYYTNAYIAETNLGWAYYQLGEKKKAISTLLKAFNDNPRYAKVLDYLGLIHFKEGNFKAAKFYFKQAIELDRISGEARYYLGEIYFREGKYQLAKDIWKSIILLAPNSKWAKKATERIYFLDRMASSF